MAHVAHHIRAVTRRSFHPNGIWQKIAFPFRVVGLLFAMVAHPERYDLDNEK